MDISNNFFYMHDPAAFHADNVRSCSPPSNFLD
jgi:hypothetical protein